MVSADRNANSRALKGRIALRPAAAARCSQNGSHSGRLPAVLSVSNDTFIVFTSNIFAILGLRSLYFALSGIMGYFQYLKYALAGILSFIGVKMCVNELMKELGNEPPISNYASLGVIVGLLTVAIVASVIVKKRGAKQAQA